MRVAWAPTEKKNQTPAAANTTSAVVSDMTSNHNEWARIKESHPLLPAESRQMPCSRRIACGIQGLDRPLLAL